MHWNYLPAERRAVRAEETPADFALKAKTEDKTSGGVESSVILSYGDVLSTLTGRGAV